MYFFPSFFLHPPLPPSFTSKAWQKAQRNLNELKWNKLTRSVFLVLLPKKKKKEYYIVVIKSSFFKLYPVLSKAANFIYDGALRLRVCGLHLFLALHQDTGAGWPFCSLVCDLWPHPHSPCIISAVGCGLESTGTQSFAAFLSFFFFPQPGNRAVQHIQLSHRYIVHFTHRWSSQRGSRRAGLAENIWTWEARTQNSLRCS